MQAQPTRNETQAITTSQSLAAVQTLLRAGIGCITFLRLFGLKVTCRPNTNGSIAISYQRTTSRRVSTDVLALTYVEQHQQVTSCLRTVRCPIPPPIKATSQ